MYDMVSVIYTVDFSMHSLDKITPCPALPMVQTVNPFDYSKLALDLTAP